MKLNSIRTKFLTLVIAAVVTTAAALLATILWQKASVRNSVTSNFASMMTASSDATAHCVYRMCAATNSQNQRRLGNSMQIAHREVQQAGSPSFSGSVTWSAMNQLTKEKATVTLPKMHFGQTWLGQNRDARLESPLVDIVKRDTRDFCTIFQRMNDSGDMLRVCTNILTAEGDRAIGTFIPRKNADGTENAVLATVLSGQTYRGRAFVVDQWHLAEYEPIWDSPRKEKVVGMLYVGVNLTQENKELRQAIMDMVVGSTGYVYIIGGHGHERGVYLISKQGKQDGKNLWDVQDASGRLVIRSIVEKALRTADGAREIERYPWKNVDEAVPRMKTVAVTYFAPWDWVIGAGTYEDDCQSAANAVAAQVNNLVRYALLCIVVVLVLLGGLSYVFANRLSKPLVATVEMFRAMARGDFTHQLDVRTTDEIGQLAQAAREMATNLGQMVAEIGSNTTALAGASTQLASTATTLARGAENATNQSTQVSAAAEQMSANMSTMASSTEEMSGSVRQVAAAVEEMTVSIAEVARSAQQAASVANTAADLARTGNAKIGELGSAAGEIGKVIEVIQDIAEQTNLLALNATIEAARAGEAGKGFAVVASEVKELARQTATATEDIRRRIEGIQNTTGQVVQAIGEIGVVVKQVDEVSRTIASAVEEQSSTTQEIARSVAQSSRTADTVARGIAESASVTREIAHNIAEVDHAAKETAQGAAVTQTVSSEFIQVADKLSTLAGQFKVPSQHLAPAGPTPAQAL